MKSRLCVALLAVLALVVANSLRAEDAPALKCPVSGQPTKADKTVDFNGGKVQFCCENCPKAFAANNAKFAGKANLQLLQTGQLKQIKCPLTGRDMNAEKTVDIGGQKIALCCGNCLAKATKASGDEQINMLLSDTKKGFETVKK